jgi:hypothetical protein
MNADNAIRTIVVIASLFSASCATLRTQTIHSSQPVWLSKTGDGPSLDKLAASNAASNKGAAGNVAPLVQVDHGIQVYIMEETTRRCQGRNVFVKVQIKEGSNKGVEGWICGASTTHHKVGAL